MALIRALDIVMKARGEDPSAWRVFINCADVSEKVIESMKEGLSASRIAENGLKCRIQPVLLNVFDETGLAQFRRFLSDNGSPTEADYILFRHMIYITPRVEAYLTGEDVLTLGDMIAIYTAVGNLARLFAKPGTRFVIEPSSSLPDFAMELEKPKAPVVLFPGMNLVEEFGSGLRKAAGILEVADLDAMRFPAGFSALLESLGVRSKMEPLIRMLPIESGAVQPAVPEQMELPIEEAAMETGEVIMQPPVKGPFIIDGMTCKVRAAASPAKAIDIWFASGGERHFGRVDWEFSISQNPGGKLLALTSDSGKILAIAYYYKEAFDFGDGKPVRVIYRIDHIEASVRQRGMGLASVLIARIT